MKASSIEWSGGQVPVVSIEDAVNKVLGMKETPSDKFVMVLSGYRVIGKIQSNNGTFYFVR